MNPEPIVTESAPKGNLSSCGGAEIFVSNDLQQLVNQLEKNLTSQYTAVRRILIIIPSNGIKSFILQSLLKEGSKLKSVFGLRFITLPQAFQLFTKITSEGARQFPHAVGLRLHIEALLENSDPSHRAYAKQLAEAFLHYGLYGSQARTEWEKQAGFQQKLWHKLNAFWDFPYQLVKSPSPPSIDYDVHIFHPTYIAPLYHRYLEHLQHHWNIQWYLLSPSPHYWGDILSDKSLSYLAQQFQKKGVHFSEISQFTQLAKTEPSLMRNLAVVTKKLHRHFADQSPCEVYTEPPRKSVLSNLQADFYHLETPEGLSLSPDDSVGISQAPSKLREIQVLRRWLEQCFSKQGLRPEQVLVLAPDIAEYAPYIAFVMASKDWGYHIAESHSVKYKHLDRFLGLVDTEFSLENCLQLLNHPEVQKLHELSEADVAIFAQCFRQAGFHWGYTGHEGTFCAALNRILDDLPYLHSTLPISATESLNSCVALIDQMHEDIQSLYNQDRTLTDWISTLQQVASKYFIDIDPLTKALSRYAALSPHTKSHLYPFDSVRPTFEETETLSASSFQEALHFASLQEGAIRPAKAICILGLNLDAFPRTRTFSSVNQLRDLAGCDKQPKIGDKDRALFFEALLCAQQFIQLSYIGPNPSYLLSELLAYLEEHYGLQDITVQHKAYNFHKSYLQEAHYDAKAYALGQKYYQTTPKSLTPQICVPVQPEEIAIKDLSQLAKHPLKLFSHTTLGIYCPDTNRHKEIEESEFFLSYLQRALLRYRYLETHQHKIPPYPTRQFGHIANTEMQAIYHQIDKAFIRWNLDPASTFSLHLHPWCTQPFQPHPHKWVVPPLQLMHNDTPLLIHGTCHNLSPKGMCLLGKGTTTEILKQIPLYILLSLHYPDLIEPRLLFTEGPNLSLPIEQPNLTQLLRYYADALSTPSPLLPQWIPHLAEGRWEKMVPDPKDPYSIYCSTEHKDLWNQHLQNFWRPLLQKISKTV